MSLGEYLTMIGVVISTTAIVAGWAFLCAEVIFPSNVVAAVAAGVGVPGLIFFVVFGIAIVER